MRLAHIFGDGWLCHGMVGAEPATWSAPWRVSPAWFALIVVAHAALLLAALQRRPIAMPAQATVLNVSLLTEKMPAASVTPEAPTQPSKVTPRTPARRPPVELSQASAFASPGDASAEMTLATMTGTESVTPSTASSPIISPAPEPPRFDADYLDNPAPFYPLLSRRLGEQGRVMLRVRVDAAGQPMSVEIHAGSGSARLDQAAIDAVRRWKFIPARLGDAAIAASVLVPIVFSLHQTQIKE